MSKSLDDALSFQQCLVFPKKHNANIVFFIGISSVWKYKLSIFAHKLNTLL